jgi:hypothetical protein
LAFPIDSVETARLRLRVPELADAQALMGMLWDPEVVELIGCVGFYHPQGQWPGARSWPLESRASEVQA